MPFHFTTQYTQQSPRSVPQADFKCLSVLHEWELYTGEKKLCMNCHHTITATPLPLSMKHYDGAAHLEQADSVIASPYIIHSLSIHLLDVPLDYVSISISFSQILAWLFSHLSPSSESNRTWWMMSTVAGKVAIDILLHHCQAPYQLQAIFLLITSIPPPPQSPPLSPPPQIWTIRNERNFHDIYFITKIPGL